MINRRQKTEDRRQIMVYKTWFLFFIFAFCILHLSLLLPAPLQANMPAPADSRQGSEAETTEILTKFNDAKAAIAEGVKPAVVNISTTRTVRTQRHPFFDDPFFRRFFGDTPPIPQERRISSLGSGVIVSPDGYILTNNHLIEKAKDILVRLADMREYKGIVVGTDPRSDIAVIKINETDLPTIPWGDSDRLRVGEIVLAVGNPFGLNQTVTSGIISALGRADIGIVDYEDFIQTDAAINPGNSGGALVNITGEIIGINTAILTVTGGYQGIGFAIPSNMAKSIKNSIIREGKVVRGYLGVVMQTLTPELARQFDIKDKKGALLVNVVEDSPAEKADLKRGDVIIQYNGKKVDSAHTFRNMVAATKPGKDVKITVIREGNILTKAVTIGKLPEDPRIAQFDNALRGITVQGLTNELRQKFGLKEEIKGVVVANIDEGSPALNVLRRGDIIMEVNRKSVTTVRQYNDIVSKIERDQGVLLLIVRGGMFQYITIPPSR